MEYEAQQLAVARLIDGEAVDETDRVAVSIKGTVNGYPAQLEAFMATWPFSVSYVVQSTSSGDRGAGEAEQTKITMVPRLGRGFFSFFSHIFLFEAKGCSVENKKLEKKYIISYDRREPAMRFFRYPGVAEILLTLEEDCKLRELVIKTDSGLFMVQGTSFQMLDTDLCRATFNYMGQIAGVLSELF